MTNKIPTVPAVVNFRTSDGAEFTDGDEARRHQNAINAEQDCICGGQGGGDVRLVRMRVTGAATAYHAKPIALCVTCRKAERGKWKFYN